jgi:hypothetical protein
VSSGAGFLGDRGAIARLWLFPSPKSPEAMKTTKYGWPHRRLRAKVAKLVATGEAVCARCGNPIFPLEPWDLGHVDSDPAEYAGPEHRRCNRATAARRAKLKRRHSREW